MRFASEALIVRWDGRMDLSVTFSLSFGLEIYQFVLYTHTGCGAHAAAFPPNYPAFPFPRRCILSGFLEESGLLVHGVFSALARSRPTWFGHARHVLLHGSQVDGSNFVAICQALISWSFLQMELM